MKEHRSRVQNLSVHVYRDSSQADDKKSRSMGVCRWNYARLSPRRRSGFDHRAVGQKAQHSGRLMQALKDLLEASAERDSGAPAIAVTYGRLLRHADEVQGVLRRSGIGLQDRVVLVAPTGPELAAAIISIAASTVCFPLNPESREDELDFYLTDLKASALIVDSRIDSPARRSAGRRGIPVVELTPDKNAGACLFALASDRGRVSTSGEFGTAQDTALGFYTSGTTKQPKKVLLTHANLWSRARQRVAALMLTERDRCLNMMPLYHDSGVQIVLATLASGGTALCPPQLDVQAFFTWLDEFHPTWYSAVPTLQHAILSSAKHHGETLERCALRFIRTGTGSLAPQVLAEIERVFAAPVIQTYGMTEVGTVCSNPMPPRPRKAGSVGVAAGPDVAIIDDKGTHLSPGKIGEVVVRGPNVFRGYEADPAASAAAFYDEWFRTGDLGVLDAEGYLFLKGRLTDLINRGGQKVSPNEVEGTLLSHPDVAEAIVFPKPHPTLGEEVAAAVVLHPDARATEQDLRRWVAFRVADFKLPRRILAVAEIPTGPTGKVRRTHLAEHFGPQLQVPYRTAEAPLEAMLAWLWGQELRADRVGLQDNFFDLGGDSLSATRVCARIEEVTGWSLRVTSLLQAPTIEQLAQLLREAKPAHPSGCLVPIQAGGSRPPLFCLHGASGFVIDYYCLARQLGPDQPVYGLQAPWIDGSPPSRVLFEEIAAQYVREIRACTPQGPYLLCGYSVAGLLAWEVAQQLRVLEQRVGMLALLDTHVYNNPARPPDRLSTLEYVFRRVEFHLDALRALSPQDRLAYVPRRLAARWHRGTGGRVPVASEARQPDVWPPLWQMVLSAGRAYRPRPYPGPLAVFLVQQRDEDLDGDRRRPGRLAAGRMEIHRVPGNHATFLKEPHVRVLAKKLRSCLDRAIESVRHGDSPPGRVPDEEQTHV
jgi:oxalate---CoA ligase